MARNCGRCSGPTSSGCSLPLCVWLLQLEDFIKYFWLLIFSSFLYGGFFASLSLIGTRLAVGCWVVGCLGEQPVALGCIFAAKTDGARLVGKHNVGDTSVLVLHRASNQHGLPNSWDNSAENPLSSINTWLNLWLPFLSILFWPNYLFNLISTLENYRLSLLKE